MPTNYSGRVTLSIVVLLAALFMIIPQPQRLWNSHLSLLEKTNLKPGIDMVGGVSLLYQIKASPGSASDPDLATKVMDALKRRVDPEGVRNLVWRPIGADELEIQMPLSAQSEDAPRKKAEYTEAQQQLNATNIRQSEVLRAVEKLTGEQRTARLNELAMGSKTRQDLFAKLAAAYDAKQALLAQKSPDVAALNAALENYDKLKAQIENTDLTAANLEQVLSIPDQSKRDAQLADLKRQFADFPKRLEAIDNFVNKFNAFSTVRNSVSDATDLKRLLQGSGVLEFYIEADDHSDPAVQAMYDRMKPGGKGPAPQPGDTLRWFEVDKPEEFDKNGVTRTTEWNDKHYLLLNTSPDSSLTHKPGSPPWALDSAYPTQTESGTEAVGFKFDAAGAKLFGDLTTRYQPKGDKTYSLAIVLDGKVISAPNLRTAITGGSGEITGDFTHADLAYLINTLNAGSLPAQLADEPISEQRVGPTLGADNLRHGLVACGFGLLVVGIFLVSYYYLAGLVAFFAVVMNIAIILGFMAALNATFTLPAIAGIVLTIGTAVDANVLVFERLREEQHRGLGLRMAMKNAFQHARSAIIDSNATTFITSLFLYWFGSEEVKGFGLTLMIGIVASLFTALFVTKTIYGILIDKYGVRHLGSLPLSFPKWDRFLKPNIDWMGMAWVFYTFSIIAISIGVVLFAIKAHQGKMMDIEFAAGTSVEVQLKHPMPIEDVRKKIGESNPDLPSPSVVSVGSDQTVYEIVTPNTDTTKVKDAVLASLRNEIATQLPSKFQDVGQPIDAAQTDNVVQPVTDKLVLPAGINPSVADDYDGGVAVMLKNLNPPLTPEQIRERIERERPQTSEAIEQFGNLAVFSPKGPNAPTDTAVVLVANESNSYAKDPAKWLQDLAAPTWKLVGDAVNRQGDLRQVNSFNPSVAGATAQDAILALTLSILVIMVYIWVRFGNLKYATATVVALLHDTIFTIAALGFAHYLWQVPGLGPLLQLEPFRINLTVVAGILTIMGYSMIDTIVVFDRIREIRGKYGYLSRQVINDAINQTLSRTLLTCGTTVVTVAFMYFMGGAGIHGFTFVLLVGILVGTYSSVAIASPILLIGAERERAESTRTSPVGQLTRVGG